jgi:gamma-glutamylputrescine oxidase
MQQPEGNSRSFWQDDAESTQQRYATLAGRASAEIAIIGGGITGVACALWLARAGRRVLLLEQETIAHGASGRNGGFLIAGTAETYERAIALYGRAPARRLFTFSAANNQTVRDLAAELEQQGWATGFRHTGSLRLADSPEELAEVQTSLALLAEDGWPSEPIDEAHLPPCLRGHYLGGAYFPDDGELQPARFVLGLARLAAQAGAVIHERTPALSIQEASDSVSIETPAGAVQTQIVIFAGNAWLSDLLRRLPEAPTRLAAGAVTPTRGQMLATSPISERLFDCPIYAHYGYQYWRQLPDGRLVVGGWRDQAPDRDQHAPTQAPTDLVQGYLERFLFEVLRLPTETPITHRWAGLMAFTPDSLPVVGWAPGSRRVLLCGGYTGHGNAMAVRCAQVAADLACGTANAEAEMFRPERLLEG